MNFVRRTWTVAWCAVALGCSSSSVTDSGAADAGPTPRELRFLGLDGGAHGVFDAAPERGPDGGLWMSFTVADETGLTDTLGFSTHVAHSDDGLTWTDDGVVNPAERVPLTGLPVDGGVWVNEVSRLRYDAYAPPSERWVLLWLRYLYLPPPVAEADRRRFDHAWMALRTAPSPLPGNWSAERKLFTGSLYLAADDALIGPPEAPLASIDARLAPYLAGSEPGVLARPDGLYVTLFCPGADLGIVFLKRDRTTGAWSYLGSVLTETQARQAGFSDYSASELVEVGGRLVLMASPEAGVLYKGCTAWEVTSLSPPTLSAAPIFHQELGLGGLGFGGACGFVDGLGSGLLYSERFTVVPEFRLYATFTAPAPR
jgi:hypothetical protein